MITKPAVHSLDEFVFSVPDLDVARRFYEHFGLDVRGGEGELGLYTYGNSHRWARIRHAPSTATKKLLWLTFGVYECDFARFEKHLAISGLALVAPPAGADAKGLWVRGTDNVPVQLRVAEKCSPSSPVPREFPPPPAGSGRAPSRSKNGQVRPSHLSHILLFSSDVEAARSFYEEALGLCLSDRSGSDIAFLHSPHGSDHHLIALARSSGPGLHHSSWSVRSLDDVGLGDQQMRQAGYGEGWGLGRHVLGSNYFRYVRDPWGSFAEYSFDIDFIPAGVKWPAKDHPAEDALYVWGPDLPGDFVVNTELSSGPTAA